jgi:hypothetical protein
MDNSVKNRLGVESVKIRRLAGLTGLLALNLSAVTAYHGTHSPTGGSALPVYQTAVENFLYLLIPFSVYSFFGHSVMQGYLDRKYRNTSLKNAKDYRNITLGTSAILAFFLMFTRAFQALPDLSPVFYAFLMASMLLAGLALVKGKEIFQRLSDR